MKYDFSVTVKYGFNVNLQYIIIENFLVNVQKRIINISKRWVKSWGRRIENKVNFRSRFVPLALEQVLAASALVGGWRHPAAAQLTPSPQPLLIGHRRCS